MSVVMWEGVVHARRPSSDLDGAYVTIGPVGTATRIEDSWFLGAGAEISLLYLRERRIPGLFGVSFGGTSYSARDGGRLWLEAETAVSKGLPFGIGLSVGASAEVDPIRVPRWGYQATLWIVAGVVPYVRVGTVEESGSFVEAGLMIKIPVRFRY